MVSLWGFDVPVELMLFLSHYKYSRRFRLPVVNVHLMFAYFEG